MVINFWRCFSLFSNDFTHKKTIQQSCTRDGSRVFCQETSWCIEVGLLVRTSQAWKTFLSPGCIKEDSWQFFSFISFLYPSLYQTNSPTLKIHIHTQLGSKKNLSVLFFIPKYFSRSYFLPPKNFSKIFIKKTVSSLLPTNDLQNLINQSSSIKTTTRLSRPLSNIITTTTFSQSIYYNPSQNFRPIKSQHCYPIRSVAQYYRVFKSFNSVTQPINKHFISPPGFLGIRTTLDIVKLPGCLNNSVKAYALKSLNFWRPYSKSHPAQQDTLQIDSVDFPPITMLVDILINPHSNFSSYTYNSTTYRTISHIWKVGVIIPFMSLEANPYIWL